MTVVLTSASTADNPMAFDTGAGSKQLMELLTLSLLGGLSMVVGADTDITASYTGACTYSAFTDYMGNCGTGSSLGVWW